LNYIALKKYDVEEEKVLILITSLMTWNNTPPNLVEIKEGKEGEEEDPAEGDEEKKEGSENGDKADDRRSED
jgi:hypothetical protein